MDAHARRNVEEAGDAQHRVDSGPVRGGEEADVDGVEFAGGRRQQVGKQPKGLGPALDARAQRVGEDDVREGVVLRAVGALEVRCVIQCI